MYADGRLVEISLPGGQSVSYAYDAGGSLSEVDYGAGAVKRYHYGEQGLTTSEFSHLLTGITSEDGQRYASFGYDAYGRVTSSRLHGVSGFVSSTQLDYVSADTVNVVTDEHGLKTYKFGPSPYRRPLSITESDGTVANQFISDRLAKTTDKKGVVTNYSYTDGFLFETRHATGTPEQRRVTLTRDAGKRVVQREVYGKAGASEVLTSVERTAYDALGRTVATCRIEPSVAAASSYVCGSQELAPLGVRQTLLTYCAQSDVDGGLCPAVGLVKAVVSPATSGANVTAYTYYPNDDATCASAPTTCPHRKGDLWKVTNALGQVTETLRYDGAGRVLSVKDANGVITDLEYHPRGWLTARKVRGTDDASEADDQVIRIAYWPTGLVKQVTQPDGAFTAYEYDAAHRLVAIADNAGNRIEYLLDNAGNRIQEDTQDANGTLKRTLSRVYNQLGQLATVADAQANPTDFGYDANGNTTSVTDTLGRETRNEYDPLNRLKRTLQDVGGIAAETTFEYDALDNLTQVTDPKGLATTYSYNGLGDLLQLSSPDTGTTAYTYDSAGNRATQTDARGVTTGYSYDALNRLTAISYPDSSLNVAYTYDLVPPACTAGETFAVGRLTAMTDGSGSTQYCYDRFGHLVRKVQTTNGVTFVLRYAYTKSGQLQHMVYPDGAVVDYVRNAQGHITEVGVARAGQPREVLLHQASYHPFGPVAAWTYGNGRTMLRPLDLDYRPLAVQDLAPGGLSLGFGFDAVGNLTQLSSGSPPPISFVYDALGRLTETRDGPTQAATDTYSYDKTGNRTAHTTAAGTNAYGYPTTSHRLTDVAGVIRAYDEAGNTLNIAAKTFVYNDANRMSQVRQAGVAMMNYAYNGKGEQVRKHLGTTSTYTVYDEAGHWVGDYDSAGNALQQALWMDDLPVGLLANGNQLHYVQPDHLGTPRTVIEVARNVPVWTWDLKG
ncbi:MAG TPA: type IV secretion protein Rhs, partial [Pseudoxanthomonas sp.]|nr:type IV secretion protein Rhs [Pseudoxanthomonas sp.]